MINVATIFSLRNFPQLAKYGYALIFYMTLLYVCFFIPSALVTAELASGWPKKGGVFLWVKEAFGPKWGLMAIFMQWFANVPWFPAMLAFMASTIAYIINPTLASNKLFVIVVVWLSLWIATFLNFRGMKLSSFLSSSGVVLGAILPVIVLIALGMIHIFSGEPLAITFSAAAFLPKLGNLNHLMFIVGILMSLAGIEISSVHITEVKNPKKNFPKAIFIACCIIIFLSIAGSLSIAIVIPIEDLSLSAGVMQGFESLCNIHKIEWAMPIIAIFIAYGAFAIVTTLIIGPSKGIREAASEGYFPKFMQKKNKYGMPTGTLIVQAFISSILSLVILFMPTVSSAFWIMSTLAAQSYFIMYLLMFAAVIKLRYSHPNTERPYKIPGGKIGIWIISGIAFLTLAFAIIFGFIPPDTVREKGITAIVSYVAFLFVGVVIFVGMPIFLYHRAEKLKIDKKNFHIKTHS